MSMNNSYRYECIKSDSQWNKNAERLKAAQLERIKADEQETAWANEAKEVATLTLHHNWVDAMDERVKGKRKKRLAKEKELELRVYRRAAIAVRRAALKQLLDREYAMYEEELHRQDKAVYIQRT